MVMRMRNRRELQYCYKVNMSLDISIIDYDNVALNLVSDEH
jgi:hypothetical protein